ncbi:MAG TPA: GNAT family N-acetyltransferase [bacterium]|nr:GNAT family N-acetyltransferase [bacterium]
MSDILSIGRPTRDELDLAVAWANAEGWNLGTHDAAVYHAHGAEGFLVARRDGTPVGFVFAVVFPGGLAASGVFIVSPAERNGEIGRRLGRAAQAHFRDWNVAIAAVPGKEHIYQRVGFTVSHLITRRCGRAVAGAGRPGPAIVVPCAELPLAAIAAYDRSCFPDDRSKLLRLWLAQPGAVALAAVDGGRVVGYGVAREAPAGHRLEPLYADNGAVAEQLLQALSARLPAGGAYYIDVPENNDAAIALARAHDWQPQFTMTRMYSRAVPAAARGHIFGEFL